MSWAAKHHGQLAARVLQQMEDCVGRDGDAKTWDRNSTPASAKSYFVRALKPNTERVSSLRNVREMHTMAVILDHLALGRSKAAADVAAQRLKALELASTSGSWDAAQYLELVPAETATLVNKEEEYSATRETEFNQRLHRRAAAPYHQNYEYVWNGSGDNGKGKGKAKGKDKGKGKGKEKGKDKGGGEHRPQAW